MAAFRVTSKCISTGETLLNTAWICRGFVSSTRPSQMCERGETRRLDLFVIIFDGGKVDKETCVKIIEAADTVKDGTKEVVKEVKRASHAITERVAKTTENMVVDVAKKSFERASETTENKRSQDLFDTAKAAAQAYKDKVAKE